MHPRRSCSRRCRAQYEGCLLKLLTNNSHIRVSVMKSHDGQLILKAERPKLLRAAHASCSFSGIMIIGILK